MCAAYLVLFVLSAALAIPGGLFMPALLLGGLFGSVFGFGLRHLLPDWHFEPGLYALCSATATLGGVFRTRQGPLLPTCLHSSAADCVVFSSGRDPASNELSKTLCLLVAAFPSRC
jgi:hypothetical protein